MFSTLLLKLPVELSGRIHGSFGARALKVMGVGGDFGSPFGSKLGRECLRLRHSRRRSSLVVLSSRLVMDVQWVSVPSKGSRHPVGSSSFRFSPVLDWHLDLLN